MNRLLLIAGAAALAMASPAFAAAGPPGNVSSLEGFGGFYDAGPPGAVALEKQFNLDHVDVDGSTVFVLSLGDDIGASPVFGDEIGFDTLLLTAPNDQVAKRTIVEFGYPDGNGTIADPWDPLLISAYPTGWAYPDGWGEAVPADLLAALDHWDIPPPFIALDKPDYGPPAVGALPGLMPEETGLI